MKRSDDGRFYQDEVDKIIAECVEQFHDIELAFASMVKRIREMPNFDEYVDDLIRDGCKRRLHSRRHHVNVAGKIRMKNASECKQPVIRRPTAGRTDVNELADANTRYVHFCSGKTIADMFGRELLEFARSELENSKGSVLNAMLAIELKKWTPDNVQVKDVVSPQIYDKLFKAALARTDRFMAQKDKSPLPKELRMARTPVECCREAAC